LAEFTEESHEFQNSEEIQDDETVEEAKEEIEIENFQKNQEENKVIFAELSI